MYGIQGSVRVIGCNFNLRSGGSMGLYDIVVPDGLDVLIKDERFTGPLRVGSSLAAALLKMRGSVRLGPCPKCEFLCLYRDGLVVPHPEEECIVAQIMEC